MAEIDFGSAKVNAIFEVLIAEYTKNPAGTYTDLFCMLEGFFRGCIANDVHENIDEGINTKNMIVTMLNMMLDRIVMIDVHELKEDFEQWLDLSDKSTCKAIKKLTKKIKKKE